MKHFLKMLGILLVCLFVLSLPGLLPVPEAMAGDCRQVRFKITNGFDSRIRVLSVRVVANDGKTWLEDIGNKKISTGRSHTTNKRRMNKLDSGQTGRFTVNFKVWDVPNNRWAFPALPDATLSQRCDDGVTIEITVRPYSG